MRIFPLAISLAVAVGLAGPAAAQRPAAAAPETEPPAVQLSDEDVQALSAAVARAVAESLQRRSPQEPLAGRGRVSPPPGERDRQQVSPHPAPAAMTLFVDIGPASRRDGAAKKLTEVYATQARLGWAVLDVELYVEDADLQGFFVTFIRSE